MADHWLVACLIPLALWTLVSGLDDLFIVFVWCLPRRRRPLPTSAALARIPERRIAVFVPLWHEDRVIGQMLRRTLSSVCYEKYDIFVGVYPNDEATANAVREVAESWPRLHVAVAPHDGPTSKGDCLNAIYNDMTAWEAARGVRFEIILTHDAEDLVYADSLRLINWFSRDHEMVQIPVLPLPTPFREFTHGVYCDEFAEFQLKDLIVRRLLGGFLPANGVGTGFERDALEALAATRGGVLFDPSCLTEDYEAGYRLHQLGYRQLFVPLVMDGAGLRATREFFPRDWNAAIRQRSRWITGIVLQGWQNHGWRGRAWELYWFWRDRKGIVGNLLSPLSNLLFLAGLWCWKDLAKAPPVVPGLCFLTLSITAAHVLIRARSSAMVYGWRFASGVPLRMFWGNLVNFAATGKALRGYLASMAGLRTLAWTKTEHVYPAAGAAANLRLGEVLVRLRCLSGAQVQAALAAQPRGVRLGEYLVQSDLLSEENLYRALSRQTGLELGLPRAGEVSTPATHALPASTSRRWKVLPYRVSAGQMHLLTPEIPTQEMLHDLEQVATLELRFRLVRPRDYDRIADQYLGPLAQVGR
ncbi:MAG: glycosyl transferase family protein [Bryobacteraceae bacterium]